MMTCEKFSSALREGLSRKTRPIIRGWMMERTDKRMMCDNPEIESVCVCSCVGVCVCHVRNVATLMCGFSYNKVFMCEQNVDTYFGIK